MYIMWTFTFVFNFQDMIVSAEFLIFFSSIFYISEDILHRSDVFYVILNEKLILCVIQFKNTRMCLFEHISFYIFMFLSILKYIQHSISVWFNFNFFCNYKLQRKKCDYFNYIIRYLMIFWYLLNNYFLKSKYIYICIYNGFLIFCF